VIRNVHTLAVTETGPAHRHDGEPSQDACLCAKGRYGWLVVVSDGLGSRPHSDHGSKNACLAAKDAVRYWSANPLSPPERLAPLIQALWRTRIAPFRPEECATTCILALRQETGQWVIGGIGDGMAVIRRGDRDLTYVIGGARSGFINETVGLGVSTTAKDWRFVAYPEDPEATLAIVATDGISDDLIPERTPPFTTWLVAEIEGLSPRQRSKTMRAMLRDWPSAKHSDDKSIGIIWESTLRGHDE
jgi:hypothetical protein